MKIQDEEADKLGEEEGCAPAGRRGDAATAGAVTYLRPGRTASNRKKRRPATRPDLLRNRNVLAFPNKYAKSG